MITYVNKTLKKAFDSMKSKGIKNIFLLTRDEIGLDMDSTVDGNPIIPYISDRKLSLKK